MTIDASDSDDGIIFERGTEPNRVRAVVMRHGQRVVSDWRKRKDAALRNLVVKLTQQLSQRNEK